jgi:thiamine-phosphate pyrophosphorylase
MMTNNLSRLHGLYVITDHDLFASLQSDLRKPVLDAIRGGARIVQYRNKHASNDKKHAEASALLALCEEHDVTLLINDDVELAKQVGAHGVHIGQSDMRCEEAREILGDDKIIGVTCHDKLALALAAEQAGADYVAFGRFFASQTKPSAPPATPEILQQAKQLLSIPVVAIGGITAGNAQILVQYGADMLAVSHSVFAANDISASARQISGLFVV